MYSHKQLSSWMYEGWHLHAKGQYFGKPGPFAKNGCHKLSAPQQQSADSVTMVKEIQNKHMFMRMLPFSFLEEDESFSITHPFSGFV
jgi:hypothetical protein